MPCSSIYYICNTDIPGADDSYLDAGTYNDRQYYSGETDGWVIYFYTGATSYWCLSNTLGGSCYLTGKSPCTSECPDLCDDYLSVKPCCPNNLVVNGQFTSNLDGWNYSIPYENWIWDSSFNGSALYDGADEGGYLSQDILTINHEYDITVDLNFSSGVTVTCTTISLYAGTNEYSFVPTEGDSSVNINITCSGNTTFSIYTLNSCADTLYITNVCVTDVTPVVDCDILDFTALFDCEYIPTPTPTPTSTLTPTPTPSSSSNYCSTVGVDAVATINQSTPTPTPTSTPTSTPSIFRDCNFSGDVVWNITQGNILCPFNQQFQDCVNDDMYYVNIVTGLNITPSKGEVFKANVNGVSKCISYVGIDFNNSPSGTIEITNGPFGSLEIGCENCKIFIPPSPTPTKTPTPTPTLTPTPTSTPIPYLPLTLKNSLTTKFDVKLYSGPSILSVDWGDGIVDGYSVAITSQTISHIYSTLYDGEIKLRNSLGNTNIREFSNFIQADNTPNSIAFKTAELGAFTELLRFICTDSAGGINLGTTSNTISGDVSDLPAGLQSFICGGSNVTSGSTIPSGLTTYENTGLNTTTGDMANVPRNMTLYRNRGFNTTYGNIDDLPITLRSYNNTGNNITTGDIGNLPPNLLDYDNKGFNTTYGNIGDLPSGMTYYLNWGKSSGGVPYQTTTGDISFLPSGLTYYSNLGQNTTFGDIANLPTNLQTFQNWGSQVPGTGQVTTGDITNLQPKLKYYGNHGANTVTGTLQSMTSPTGLTFFESIGFNTISGEMHNIPDTITYFQLIGNSNNIVYSGKTWPSASVGVTGVQLVGIIPNDSTFDVNEANRLVTDLSGLTWSQYPNVDKEIKTPIPFSSLLPDLQFQITGLTGSLKTQNVGYNGIT